MLSGSESAEKRKEAARILRESIIETMRTCPGLVQADLAAMHGITQQAISWHLKRYKSPISDKGPADAYKLAISDKGTASCLLNNGKAGHEIAGGRECGRNESFVYTPGRAL